MPDPCPCFARTLRLSASLSLHFNLRQPSPSAHKTSCHQHHKPKSLTCRRWQPGSERGSVCSPALQQLQQPTCRIFKSALLLRPTTTTLCDLIGPTLTELQISSDFLSASIDLRFLQRQQRPSIHRNRLDFWQQPLLLPFSALPSSSDCSIAFGVPSHRRTTSFQKRFTSHGRTSIFIVFHVSTAIHISRSSPKAVHLCCRLSGDRGLTICFAGRASFVILNLRQVNQFIFQQGHDTLQHGLQQLWRRRAATARSGGGCRLWCAWRSTDGSDGPADGSESATRPVSRCAARRSRCTGLARW